MDRTAPLTTTPIARSFRPRLVWEIGAALAGLAIGTALSFAAASRHAERPPAHHQLP